MVFAGHTLVFRTSLPGIDRFYPRNTMLRYTANFFTWNINCPLSIFYLFIKFTP